MMMALGQFVFAVDTVAYQELQRKTTWRHPSNSRVGARAARQFVGPGEDTIGLSGVLHPTEFGSSSSTSSADSSAQASSGAKGGLNDLREMGASGLAWPLVDGAGQVFGKFVIEDLTETGTLFIAEGLPRRIEFRVNLVCVDDGDAVDAVGTGGSTVPGG